MSLKLKKDASGLLADATERKHLNVKFKPATQKELLALGDLPDGYVAGWASTKDLDSYRHVLMPGAMQESISKRGLMGPRGIKLLIGHNWNQVAGLIKKLEYRGGNLWIEAQLNLELGYAKDAYLAAKMLDGLNFSVGIMLETYSVAGEEGEEYLRIDKADLYEVSVVPFPGNEAAEMTFVKGADMNNITTVAGFEKALVASGLVKSRNEARRVTQEIKQQSLLAKELVPSPDEVLAPEIKAPVVAIEKIHALAALVAKMKETIAA